METAACFVSISDYPFEDIAAILGFASEDALSSAIESWSGRTATNLRDLWKEREINYVVWRYTFRGKATPEQAREVIGDLRRLYLDVDSSPAPPSGS